MYAVWDTRMVLNGLHNFCRGTTVRLPGNNRNRNRNSATATATTTQQQQQQQQQMKRQT